MIVLGFNIVFILASVLGSFVNWIINKKIEYKLSLCAFWLGLVWGNTENYSLLILAVVLGFLGSRYCIMFGDYLEAKWKARQNRVRWGKYINK